MFVLNVTTALILGIVIGAMFAPFWMMVWGKYILPGAQWVKAKVQDKLKSRSKT